MKSRRTNILKRSILCLSLFIFLLLTGCTSRAQQRLEVLNESIGEGDFKAVIAAVRKNEKLYGRPSLLLYYADIGVLYHYAGEYDSSNIYLEKTVGVFDELFSKSITNEAASLVTNDNLRPYRSKPYEMIFIHQIMAFNYLALGDVNAALVETRRTQLLVDEWARKDKRDRKFTDDGLFQYISAINYNKINEPGNASVSLYKSIKAYQHAGIKVAPQVENMAYHLFEDQGRERDIEELNLNSTTSPDQAGVSPDQAEIIVVGYGGRGPTLGETVWWGSYIKDGMMILHYHDANGNEMTESMSAPYVPEASGETFSLKFAMPMSKKYNSPVKGFSVQMMDGKVYHSDMVNDLDRLNERYVDDNHSKNLARTIVRVATRTIATEKAKDAMKTENALANLFINITTDVAAGQLEKADTRGLYLVPKNIHMTRIPVEPGKHTIRVSATGNSGNKLETKEFLNVPVKRGEKKFVFMHAMF